MFLLLLCIGICWCELCGFNSSLSNSISHYAKWEQQEIAQPKSVLMVGPLCLFHMSQTYAVVFCFFEEV